MLRHSQTINVKVFIYLPRIRLIHIKLKKYYFVTTSWAAVLATLQFVIQEVI